MKEREREKDSQLVGCVWLFISSSESCEIGIDGFVIEFNGRSSDLSN